MPDFVSLKASGLSDTYDPESHGGQPIVKVEEKKDTIEVAYIFPGFTISDDNHEIGGKSIPFKEVGVSGAGFISESGYPLLPSFGRYVQIPLGCDFEIAIKTSKPMEFEDVLVTPAQEEAKDGVESEFEYDEKAYSKDALYPERIVDVSGPQNMDDYNVLLVHTRPLQYNPSKRLLLGFSNVTVIIKLSPKEKVDDEGIDEYPFVDPLTNREGFGNLVLNPRRRIRRRIEGLGPHTIIIPPITPKVLEELLIIYSESLKKPAEELAKWKIKRGLPTETVSITKVGNTVAKIKAYIRNRRKQTFSKLRYVLLLGDVGDIVTEQTGSSTTDHYYYTAKDTSSATECLLPWVSGGRIPVATEKEGMNVVQQIIRYEKRPSCDPEYYRRMTFAAYFQDNTPQDGKADRAYMKTMEGIRNHMITLGFDVERVYVSNNPNPQKYKDGTSVSQEVKNAIVDGSTATDMLISETSEGQLAIGHRDHGGTTGWIDPPFNTDHLESILSQYPSVFFSINCYTGRFDANPTDSFAEAALKLDGGPPSLIACTEASGTWRNDSMMKALFDAMWPGVIPTFPGTTASYAIKHNRLGDILNYAKSYLPVAHGSTSGVKHHFEIYHVIGDPTLQLLTDAPLTIDLRAYVLGNMLHINTGASLKSSVLTVWHKDKLLKRMEVTSPRVTIPLRDLQLLMPTESERVSRRGIISVCFSALGCRFIEKKLRL